MKSKMIFAGSVLIAFAIGCTGAIETGRVPQDDATLRHYGAVRPKLEMLPAGAVKPKGWILDVAKAQRDGLTSRMDEKDAQFARAWRKETTPQGKDLHWDSEPGAWSLEGGSYWFDGLVRLSCQLDDEKLKVMASNRLDCVLSRMSRDAIGFCWWMDRNDTSARAAIESTENWIAWVTGSSERAIAAWYEVTGDERSRSALASAFDEHIFTYRNYTTTPAAAYDAYRLTGDARVASALDSFYERLGNNSRTIPRVFRQYAEPPTKYLEETLYIKRRHQWALYIPSRHGVLASEALLGVFRGYMWTGNTNYLDCVRRWYAFFDKYAHLPFGTTVMDEEWGYPGPKRGTETCDVAAESWTRIQLLAALGEGRWGDDVERTFFNAAPNCATADFRRHVYFQQPNRTEANDLSECSYAGDKGQELGRYKDKHWPLCCTAALNRILPNYVQSMWMVSADGGVAAALYGPCSFSARLKGGMFEVEEETDYPFDETVTLRIRSASAGEMPLRLRIPSWCGAAEISINGSAADFTAVDGFALIRREWKAGDVVGLKFPMQVVTGRTDDYLERNKSYCHFMRGPLLFAKEIPGSDENTPAGEVSAPVFSSDDALRSVRIVRRPMPKMWRWNPDDAPVRLKLKDSGGVEHELVPYGCAKLRISMFADERKKDRGKNEK